MPTGFLKPAERAALAEAAAGELALFPNLTTGAATLRKAAPGTSITVLDALGCQLLAATADAASGSITLRIPWWLPAPWRVRWRPALLALGRPLGPEDL